MDLHRSASLINVSISPEGKEPDSTRARIANSTGLLLTKRQRKRRLQRGLLRFRLFSEFTKNSLLASLPSSPTRQVFIVEKVAQTVQPLSEESFDSGNNNDQLISEINSMGNKSPFTNEFRF